MYALCIVRQLILSTFQARSQGGVVGADAPPSQIKGPLF